MDRRNSNSSWHNTNKHKRDNEPTPPASQSNLTWHSTLIPFHSIRYVHTYIDNYRKKKWGDDVTTNVSNRFELSYIEFDCFLRILIRHISDNITTFIFKLRHTRKSKPMVMEWTRKSESKTTPTSHSLSCMYTLIYKKWERDWMTRNNKYNVELNSWRKLSIGQNTHVVVPCRIKSFDLECVKIIL